MRAAEGRKRKTLLWLQSGGCGGCSLSLLGAEGPDLYTAFDAAGIEVLWHPSISVGSGADYLALLERVVSGEQQLDFLCLEGAVMRGPNGTGRFHMMAGTDRPVSGATTSGSAARPWRSSGTRRSSWRPGRA